MSKKQSVHKTNGHFHRRTFLEGALAVPLLGGVAVPAWAKSSAKANYHIESIELFTRVSPPGRMEFAIGKQAGSKSSKPLSNPIGYVKMILRDAAGNRTFGCSGERLSVRWLDKRPRRPRHLKLVELVDLIEQARKIYLTQADFDNPFGQWHSCYKRIHEASRAAGHT